MVAKDSSVLESVPTTSRKIPACWKACRPRRERFQHAGKHADHVAKDSSMLESILNTNLNYTYNEKDKRNNPEIKK